jgi:hypothetical protein
MPMLQLPCMAKCGDVVPVNTQTIMVVGPDGPVECVTGQCPRCGSLAWLFPTAEAVEALAARLNFEAAAAEAVPSG